MFNLISKYYNLLPIIIIIISAVLGTKPATITTNQTDNPTNILRDIFPISHRLLKCDGEHKGPRGEV